MVSPISRRGKQLLPGRRHDRGVADAATLQELGDRQRSDGLVAVEEPRPVCRFSPAASPLGGRRDDLTVDLRAHEAVADPDRHEEPSPAREPAVGWKRDEPDPYDGPSRHPGSQLREPLPSGSPGLAATPRGESAGGGSPPHSVRPAQTADSCRGVKGSPVQIRPSRPAGKVR
jgi:hypothetical protein